MVSVRYASEEIKRYLEESNLFNFLHFNCIEEDDYCAYYCDELEDDYLLGFGGQFQSSIIFRYSLARGLEIEVYLSDIKAKQIGDFLDDLIFEINSKHKIDYYLTDYIPRESSKTFSLNVPIETEDDLLESIPLLGSLINQVSDKLGEY